MLENLIAVVLCLLTTPDFWQLYLINIYCFPVVQRQNLCLLMNAAVIQALLLGGKVLEYILLEQIPAHGRPGSA